MNKTTKIVLGLALVGIAAYLVFKKPEAIAPPTEAK